MGVGEYLGGKSEREVVQNAIDLESRELVEKPEDEIAEQVGYYRIKGFTQEEAEMIVRRLVTNHTIWLNEMVRDEFGVDPRIVDADVVEPAFKLGVSFAVGAAVPILPHLLPISHIAATGLSAVAAGAVLFSIGFISGRLSGRNPIKKGLEIVFFGALVFAVSSAAGHWIPPLFGHAPVATGG
jgi:VIT1/CCC1 family predicted Fe2+/Mn2+ transporter